MFYEHCKVNQPLISDKHSCRGGENVGILSKWSLLTGHSSILQSSIMSTWSAIQLTVVIYLVWTVSAQTVDTKVKQFLDDFEAKYSTVKTKSAEVEYALKTNITTENEETYSKVMLEEDAFRREWAINASRFKNVTSPDYIRQLYFIQDIGEQWQTDTSKSKEMNDLLNKMSSIYAKGKICLNNKPCMAMEPDIHDLMASSTDYDELLEAWIAWRDATGRKMKPLYKRFVELYNEAIRLSGHKDAGEYWRSWYETPTFEEDLQNLLHQVRPLYELLHAYVRRRLKEIYPKDKFPASGHIPAHLLGDMWAQEWTTIIDRVKPFADKPSLDVTEQMKEQASVLIDFITNYNVTRMFRTAEDFFQSLGWEKMVPLFWSKSMMERPKDKRDVVCHASAWDFNTKDDFRIKMCTSVTQQDLMVIHHEMGHIQYYMHYKDQPTIYREGANNGFHEAIGDVMALSAQTPEHLNKIGLLSEIVNDNETDINFLMNMALQKIAFIPFGYLIDQWRWSVFSGETEPEKYTDYWWELRCRHQGLAPPVARTPEDFDPGAKYHVANNVPYIRYFISFIIQFQFHKAACEAAGHQGPLHRCDIYNSTDAGTLIGDMLEMGRSKPWPEAMYKVTKQRIMDAGPLLEYFKPLLDFLKNEVGNDYGWDPHCPVVETHGSDYKSPLETCTANRASPTILDVDRAEEFLRRYNTEAETWRHAQAEAEFDYESNLTDENKNKKIKAELDLAKFELEKQKEAWQYNITGMPENIKRQFKFIRDIGQSAQSDQTKIQQLEDAKLEMQSIYGKAKVCLKSDQCLSLEPELTQLMAESRDYDELLAAWKGWRDVTGPKMKKKYTEYTDLYNEAIRLSCFKDGGEYWRSWYDSATFQEDIAQLYSQIQPLYEQLHAYVRRKLKGIYPKDKFPASGHIPAHILGNMWAQDWTEIVNDTAPYPDKPTADVTEDMQKQAHIFLIIYPNFVLGKRILLTLPKMCAGICPDAGNLSFG
ncbi:hypothetical protein Btru_007067 [Bulinus truncatus]|nr:hypothetical protein Btru_007067 [Bulinus truncatus]